MCLKVMFLQLTVCDVLQKSWTSCLHQLAIGSPRPSIFSGELLIARKELMFNEYIFRENTSNLRVQLVMCSRSVY